MAAATDDQTTNPSGQLLFPQDQGQGHDHPPMRRSSGRRKSKGCCESSSPSAVQKKKQPQRGMGVEKLERLRLQERWKKMTEISNHQADPTNILMNNSSAPAPLYHQLPRLGGYWSPNVSSMNQNRQSYLGFHGQMFVGGGGGLANSYMFGINNNSNGNGCLNHLDFLGKNFLTGLSMELSSTPNACNCYSEQCHACHKKKKVNGKNLGYHVHKLMSTVGDCGFLGLNPRDDENSISQENQGLGTKTPLGVEVVAVHRKGSYSSEGGRMVVEYEFFPSSRKAAGCCTSDSQNDELVMMKLDGASESTASPTSSIAGFDASNCIDLSLKLSY